MTGLDIWASLLSTGAICTFYTTVVSAPLQGLHVGGSRPTDKGIWCLASVLKAGSLGTAASDLAGSRRCTLGSQRPNFSHFATEWKLLLGNRWPVPQDCFLQFRIKRAWGTLSSCYWDEGSGQPHHKGLREERG